MEALATVGLVANVVQFIDFGGKLISKTTELYGSNEGALEENIALETVTNHVVLLNDTLRNAATAARDDALKKLCESCKAAAEELLEALSKVKVDGPKNRWKSVRKALRSVWSKEKVRELEGRLARFREQLNLHITVDLREQVSRLHLESSDRFNNLDTATQNVMDAIIKQQDIFKVTNNAQISLMGRIHKETMAGVKSEHEVTRREIVGETLSVVKGEHKSTRQEVIEKTASNIQAEHAITRRLIEGIKNFKLESDTSNPKKSCWSVPFPKNRHFVARDAHLRELESKLFDENCSRLAVIGLGGVGKTQIVLELAYKTKEKRPECSVFWIFASSVKNLQQAYLDIAQQLRIPGIEGKKEDAIQLVKQYLSQESAGQWLLILDNADDLDMWFKESGNGERLIDSLPRSDMGSIVFTTRSRKAALKFAPRNVIHVTEMDEEGASQVLRNSLADKERWKDPTLPKLLELLTFLPLAIVQAAAYINSNDISLGDYVSLFDDHEESIIDVFSEDFEDEGRYHAVKNPIATTWLISFDQIRLRDPLAAEYLSFMSCIEPKAIPVSLLPPAPTKKQHIDAIGTLSAYSFISKRANNSLDLHRLVHLATRNWLRNENMLDKWADRTLLRLAEAFHDFGNVYYDAYGSRDLWRGYLPHTRFALADNAARDHSVHPEELLLKFADCLLSDGRYDEAERSITEVFERRRTTLGPEHPDTLYTMTQLTFAYRCQGRLKEAEVLGMNFLVLSKQILGAEHISVLGMMVSMARILISQCRFTEAEVLGTEALSRCQNILGEAHDITLRCVDKLAAIYQGLGRLKEAEELWLQVLQTRRQVFGDQHLSTLGCKIYLAALYLVLGEARWKEAEELAIQVIETQTMVIGQDHPNTLNSMSRLALVYLKQGRWKDAEEINAHLLIKTQEVRGREHLDTTTIMYNLACTWRKQKRHDEAVALMQDCLELRRRILGPDHLDTERTFKVLEIIKREREDLKSTSGLNTS